MKNSLRILCLLLIPAFAQGDMWRSSEIERHVANTLVASAGTTNFVFSPFALSTAMAMLGEGLGDSARMQVLDELHVLADFGEVFRDVFARWEEVSASNQVRVSVAPSLWFGTGRTINKDYIHLVQQDFRAEVGPLFHPWPINAVTAAKTDEHISEILSEIPRQTPSALLAGVAFEGAWAKGFDPRDTRKKPFASHDGTRKPLALMRGEIPVRVITNELFTLVSIPFAVRGFQFLCTMPAPGVPFDGFRARMEKSVPLDELKARLRAFDEADPLPTYRIELPEMKLTSNWDMRPALAVFKVPESNFPNIAENFKVGLVRQAAYIRIGEAGYSLTPGVTPPVARKAEKRHRSYYEDDAKPKATTVTGAIAFDRPFLWCVWDATSDVTLLIGQFTGSEEN